MKKIKRIFCLFLMAFALLAGSVAASAETDAIDQIKDRYGITEEQINASIEEWIGELAAFTEEQVDQLAEEDEMASTWRDVSEGAGEFVEVVSDGAEYEITDEGFKGHVPVKMENKQIYVDMVFSMAEGTVDVTFSDEGGGGDLSLLDILKKAGINTLIGMGTVFIILILISFLIWLLKFVPDLIGGKKKQKEEEKAETPVPVMQPPTVSKPAPGDAGLDDGELVAVIAAAIAEAEGTSTDSFVVRSIRRARR